MKIFELLRMFVFLSLLVSSVFSAERLRIYHVGNSLTWDAQPATQASVLSLNGYTVDQGYHIASGKSLSYIVENPGYYSDPPPPHPFGAWENALQNYEWDVITVQAYPGSTGRSEVNATIAIIEKAISGNRNGECVFYLYLAWPDAANAVSLASRVDAPFGGDGSSVFLSSGFLDYWHDKITSSFPELDVRVVPTGVVLATIDGKLREVEIAPYGNAYDLYRDAHHMNYLEGRHVAMASMLSTISGIRPQDISYPVGYFSDFNQVFVELANDVVWYTLSNDSRTQIKTEAEISIRRAHSGTLECVFLGTLWQSYDLKSWSEVDAATSPYRINSSGRSISFYRSTD